MTTPPTIEYASRSQPIRGTGVSRRGKGALALAASMFLPGLGQILAGERRRGLKWLVVYALAVVIVLGTYVFHRLFPVLIVVVPVHLILQLACFIDAYRIGRRSPRDRLRSPGLRYLAAFCFLLAAMFANPVIGGMLIARRYLAEAYSMPTPTMAPTVLPHDRLIVHKLLEPRRWDVIAFRAPDEGQGRQIYLKRLVGLPGEWVEIIDGAVHINGKPLATPSGLGPYLGIPPRAAYNLAHNGCTGYPIQLAGDEYYVLGDNSPISGDSRFWRTGTPGHQPGTLGRADIIGRATYIYWPPSHWRSLEP